MRGLCAEVITFVIETAATAEENRLGPIWDSALARSSFGCRRSTRSSSEEKDKKSEEMEKLRRMAEEYHAEEVAPGTVFQSDFGKWNFVVGYQRPEEKKNNTDTIIL